MLYYKIEIYCTDKNLGEGAHGFFSMLSNAIAGVSNDAELRPPEDGTEVSVPIVNYEGTETGSIVFSVEDYEGD